MNKSDLKKLIREVMDEHRGPEPKSTDLKSMIESWLESIDIDNDKDYTVGGDFLLKLKHRLDFENSNQYYTHCPHCMRKIYNKNKI